MTLPGVPLVVDGSLAAKWLVEEADSPRAWTLVASWQQAGVRPVVPAWGFAEDSNTLLQHVRRETVLVLDAQDNEIELLRFVDLVPHDPPLSRCALGIAHQLGLGATSDANYLALAERLGCELWTADVRLWRAATASPLFPFVHGLHEVDVAPPEAAG